MTENLQELAEEQIQIEAPTVSEPEISLEEINKQIKHYWGEVDKQTTYTPYAEAFKQLDYYRDLKQKLYK